MTLAQTTNTAQVIGVLKNVNNRNNGEEKIFKGNKPDKFGNLHDRASGEFEVQVSPDTVVTVKYSEYKTRTDQKTNTVVESSQYKSLKTLLSHPLETPIAFNAKQGGIELQAYYTGDSVDNLELKQFVNFKTRYISTPKNVEEKDFKAAFEIEGYLGNLQVPVEEGQKGKITVLAIDFKGQAIPYTFDITPEGAEYFEATAEVNQKIRVSGRYLLDESQQTTTVAPVALGFGVQTVDEVQYDARATFVVEAGIALVEDVDTEEIAKDLTEAKAAREASLEVAKSRKAENLSKGNSTKNANTSGFGQPKAATAPSAFGAQTAQTAPSPFAAPASQTATNPFGGSSPF